MLKRSPAQTPVLSPRWSRSTAGPERLGGPVILPENRWRAFWRHLRHGWCRHRNLVRVKVEGIWAFKCSCGYQVPIVKRTADERARARRLGGTA